jgi:hypothetical protein
MYRMEESAAKRQASDWSDFAGVAAAVTGVASVYIPYLAPLSAWFASQSQPNT